MFNSPARLATMAALIGAVANTLRLELVILVNANWQWLVFIGALTGDFCFSDKNKAGYLRISSIVFGCNYGSGLYLYRGIYNLV